MENAGTKGSLQTESRFLDVNFIPVRSKLTIILILISLYVSAQTFTGVVVDAETKKPVPFTNIAFGNGKTGTVTDLDGKFKVSLKELKNPITFTSIGYEKKETDIISLLNSSVIELRPAIIELNEVNIYPGKNPALIIMENVVKNKDLHNPDLSTNYSCVIYHKLNFTINIPDTVDLLEYPDLVKLKNLTNRSDLLLIESVSEKKHLKPNKTNERLISGRVSGFKDPALSYLPAQLQPFTFYNKYIKLLDMQYLNPVSEQGLNLYSFLLKDTIIDTKGDTIFYIKFKPKKGKNFAGLTGALHIFRNDWAVKTVNARSPDEHRSNGLSIKQNYQLINNSVWFPYQMESTLIINNINTSKNKETSYPITATGKSYVTAIDMNPDITAKNFNNITFKYEPDKNSSANIRLFRYEPLSHKDSMTYHMIDSIGLKMKLDKIIALQKAAVKGNIPWGIIDIDYRRLMDYNGFEGFKLGIGLWTNKKLSKYFSFGGYHSCGFKSKKSNYGGGFNITPWKDPDAKLSFMFKNDVYATGTFDFLDAYLWGSPESFQRFMFVTMDKTKEFNADIQFRFLKYFKTKLGFNYSEITPVKHYRFSALPDTVPPFDTKEIDIKLKWANKETFSDTPFGRVTKGTRWPVLWFNFTYGLGNNTEKFTYQKYEAQINQNIRYNPANISTVRIKAGQISGEVPSTLLYSAFGSYKTLGLEIPFSMATMRLNEFAANRFVILNLAHQISLFQNKKQIFKPEIVLTTNIGFGSGPDYVYSFGKGYYESGIFFNNLLKQLIAKYGIGIHYRYGPYHLGKEIDNWAFNIGIEFMF